MEYFIFKFILKLLNLNRSCRNIYRMCKKKEMKAKFNNFWKNRMIMAKII